MTYTLGKRSRKSLEGVHPKLVEVVERAIQITTQDFTVIEGCRTLAKQREYVAKGASKTLKSNHLVKEDGFGYAVDLAAYVSGDIRWEQQALYPICLAMGTAARELKVPIRWGGFWGLISPMQERPVESIQQIDASVHAYVDMRRSRKQSVFLDLPHYEYRPDLG